MENTKDQYDHEAFREIFLSCVEGILVFEEGKVIMANPQSCILFGYKEEEMKGQLVEQFIPMKMRKSHVKIREGFMEKPNPRQMGIGRDLMAVKKGGTEFPVEVSLNPAMIDGRKTVIAHIIDISTRKIIEGDLKRSEEQLLQYATELEKRVQERTKELAAVVNELQTSNSNLEVEIKERVKAENEAQIALEKERELNELKTRFVSMASHEFRTPLSTILSSVSLIARYDTDDKLDKREKHIGRIKSNVSELTTILNDFLSIDKIDTGKMSVKFSEFEINALLKEIVSEISVITKKDQYVSCQVLEGEHWMKSDPMFIKQCVVNLLSNAIKYSPTGSEIQLNLKDLDDSIQVDVVDNGIGIPENDQKHLFEKFFRAHNSQHIQGTGLGLNIVKKYLEMLNGSISFTSVEGKGSTFTIKFKKQ
ncbi:MAG: PAS domain-containing sensor histidine kinase [Reichenbachiella sp.]